MNEQENNPIENFLKELQKLLDKYQASVKSSYYEQPFSICLPDYKPSYFSDITRNTIIKSRKL